jgi:hypothetical protein
MTDLFNAHNSYVAVPNPVQSTSVQSPTSRNLNPVGSEYSSEFSITAYDTDLINRAISATIFDAVPAKYKTLRLLFDKPVVYVAQDVFTYMEKTFGRTALKVLTQPVLLTKPLSLPQVVERT